MTHRRRYPTYANDSDYTTNSPSYYEDLARKNKLIQLSAERIFDFQEELVKRFDQWDKNIETMPEDLVRLLQEWMNDGSLDTIINTHIFSDLNDKLDNHTLKISDIENLITTINNELVIINNEIEKIDNELNNTINHLNEKAYYNFKSTEHFDEMSKSKYYITRVPYKDEEGNRIVIKRGFANDSTNGGMEETARSFSKRHNASLVINAGTGSAPQQRPNSTSIHKGKIVYESNLTGRYPLAISDEGILRYFHFSTSAQEILNNGYNEVTTAFIPLVVNGSGVTQAIHDSLDNGEQRIHPRQVIGQLDNNDYLILTVDGRNEESEGMDSLDLIRILLSYNVKFGYMLDGGGSSTTVNRHKVINRPPDNYGYTERKVRDFIYFKKETNYNHDSEHDLMKEIGNLATDYVKDLNRGELNGILRQVDNINTVSKSGIYWTKRTTIGSPDNDTNWLVIHAQLPENARLQIAFPFTLTSDGARKRRTEIDNEDKFLDWIDV